MAVQLLFCGVLLPGFVQDSVLHSCKSLVSISKKLASPSSERTIALVK